MPTSNLLHVTIVCDEDRAIVRLKGEAGLPEANQLDHQLLALVARKPARVVFDVSELRFIASLALSVLLQFQRGISASGGTVCLAGADSPVMDLIRKTRLDTVFKLHDSVSAALESVQA
jgi:anti-anti-sigma factor